jgi:hypothetical protein
MATEASAGMQNLNIQDQAGQQEAPKPTVILVIGAAANSACGGGGGGRFVSNFESVASPGMHRRHGWQRQDNIPAAAQRALAREAVAGLHHQPGSCGEAWVC